MAGQLPKAIDFNVLVDNLTGQTYDAIIVFWGTGFPFDPDGTTGVFGRSADIPASGFSYRSYYNAVSMNCSTLPAHCLAATVRNVQALWRGLSDPAR
ncbi:MAG: hypothetical protein IPK52_10685 [Chloroflexi bacterium]|nr:hypothetical protein [Chloroflexota bacterium]